MEVLKIFDPVAELAFEDVRVGAFVFSHPLQYVWKLLGVEWLKGEISFFHGRESPNVVLIEAENFRKMYEQCLVSVEDMNLLIAHLGYDQLPELEW